MTNSPERIISLVPSITELLSDLGMDEKVIGITKFCVHPDKWFREKQRIGGTKTVNISAVKALQPDLIIANKEENVKEQVEELQSFTRVIVTDINTLQDALQMITEVGFVVNKQQEANKLVREIEAAFDTIRPLLPQPRTAYLIWKDPYMAAGGDTFINDLMVKCGFDNIFKNINRYPIVSLKQLQDEGCQLLLLSSEPYPFKQKHLPEIQEQLPETKILLVDGEMFSWYGSRLTIAATYFCKLVGLLQL